MIWRLWIIVLALLAPPALAQDERVVAGLSRDDVDITTSFDGSDIIIYGAIKREVPIPEEQLDVIVVVQGPSSAVTIRRKDRHFGVWLNSDSVGVGAAPDFYVVTSTRPLHLILPASEDARYRISIPEAVRAFAGELSRKETEPFTDALLRLRKEAGLYRQDEGAVTLVEQTLFRADIRMPANVIEGIYSTRILLLRDGKVIDTYRAPIEVRKVGLERWLYHLAMEQPLIYGMMSLAIAVAAAWLASVAFRAVKRS